MSDDTWAAGPASPPSGDLPPPPAEQGAIAIQSPTGAPRRGTAFRVLTGAMMVFGGLTALGAVSAFTKDDPENSGFRLVVILALGVGTFVGGLRLSRNGWQPGHEALNVVAVLPAAVLSVLFLVGAVEKATESHPPTDSYGYTEFERQEFLTGCGGGAVCTCLFDAIEKNFSHDEFIAEARTFAETGTFSPEMTGRLNELYQTSGCFP